MGRYTQSLMLKLKCRISLNSIKNLIGIEKLVDESFTGSCILKLYQCYIGETNSISLSVQEIFAERLEGIESYLDDESETESESHNFIEVMIPMF